MKQKHWKVSVFNKTSETIKNDMFYTTDTEVYLIFELIDEGFTPDTATVTVYNVNGKATINVNVEVVGRFVHYEIPEEAIGHPGGWRTQMIFTKDGEDYTTNIIEFEVSGHLLDNQKPKLVAISNWNKFIKHAEGLIDDWEQLEEIRQANELERVNAESVRSEFYAGFESELNKKANKQQEAWQTLTLLNGVTGSIKIMKDSFGFVHLEGEFFNDVWTSGLNITTLPSGYKPETVKHFISPANYGSTAVRAFIMTSGGDVYNYGTVGQRGYINIVYKAGA